MKDWRNLALLGVALLVGVGLFEIGMRTLPVHYDLSPSWRYHPVLGWSQVPNASFDVIRDDRSVHVAFNSLGFRDREHQRVKPAGVRRIVVIGDSFCEAIQVSLEETFHQQLERLLNERGADRWEVINLGVGDFGTAQAYIALREYGLAYDPDVIIQQIFPFNDICNNSIGLYGLCRSNNDRYRPYFVEVDGQLRQVSADPVRTYLRRELVTYHVLEYWFLRLFGPDPQDPDDPGRPRRLRARGYTGLDPLFYTYVPPPDEPPAVAEGWRITERLIERTVALAKDRGIAYVGLVIPLEPRLRADWDSIAARLPPPPMRPHYPEDRLGSLFDRLEVPSVMALDAFRPYRDEVLPYLGGHLSQAGHRRAAEALFRVLVEAGIVRLDSTPGRAVTVPVARVPDIVLPHRLDVGDPAARRWLPRGWYAGEGSAGWSYAWSAGERSILAVPLLAGQDLRMTFEALPFEFEGSAPQRITLALNGTEIGQVSLRPGWQSYSVTLPADGLKAPIDTIEFRYAFATVPKDVAAASSDDRRLAVAWHSIAFAKAP